MKRNKAVDLYIKKSKDFAQPILTHFRELVHKNCPDVEESIKWSFPHFEYKGILCSMASFKEHCAIGFWKGPLIEELIAIEDNSAMGQLGRITALKDLPSDKVLGKIIKRSVTLNEDGIKSTVRTKSKKPKELNVPESLMEFIRKNRKAFATFNKLTVSKKMDYVSWIEEAKTETTRLKRTDTMLEWLEEGKDRNWKYKKE